MRTTQARHMFANTAIVAGLAAAFLSGCVIVAQQNLSAASPGSSNPGRQPGRAHLPRRNW